MIENEVIEENKSTELSLSTPQEILEQKILEEDNIDELKNIIDLFNLNIKKKDIIRTGKISELQDKVYTQMSERLDKHAGEFSNKDLLDYFKTMQETINKSNATLNDVNTPQILLNQQNVSVNIDGNTLDRESRKRVADVVKQLLENSGETLNIDDDIITLNDGDEINE